MEHTWRCSIWSLYSFETTAWGQSRVLEGRCVSPKGLSRVQKEMRWLVRRIVFNQWGVNEKPSRQNNDFLANYWPPHIRVPAPHGTSYVVLTIFRLPIMCFKKAEHTLLFYIIWLYKEATCLLFGKVPLRFAIGKQVNFALPLLTALKKPFNCIWLFVVKNQHFDG